MSDQDDRAAGPLAREAWDALAEAYAACVDTKPHNAFYERPATLSLLPEVRGLRVLDAGCGPGVYAEWLAERGAEVVALDADEKMVRFARERTAGRAEVVLAALDAPLDFLAADSFDLVLSALVIDYVRDWAALFAEFRRVLRARGRLVFSVGHPFADHARHPEGNYFETELHVEEWKGFGGVVPVPVYRRPLGALVNTLLDAGFVLERIIEPTPTDEFRARDPRHYAELARRPGFLCVRAAKRPPERR